MSDSLEQVQRAFAVYIVERELGSGGMATVYLAHDKKHDRKVAIKVLHAELAAVLGAERFLQEIRVTANLQHPHILGLIDSGMIGEGELHGRPYYVMPYVGGASRASWLQPVQGRQNRGGRSQRLSRSAGSSQLCLWSDTKRISACDSVDAMPIPI